MKIVVISLVSLLMLLSTNAYTKELKLFESEIQSLPADTLTVKYDRTWPLTSTLTRVMKDGLTGVVSNDGLIVLPLQFKQIWDIDSDNNIKVLSGDKLGLYNLNGQIIIPAEFDYISQFQNSLARVTKDGLTGYYSADGKMVIPCIYEQIWDFENGRAKVLRNGLVGFVSSDGREVVGAVYQQIWNFENGRARVLKSGKIGYINENGVEIIPAIFTQIWDFENGRAKAIYDGRLVWIDENGVVTDHADYPTGYAIADSAKTDGHSTSDETARDRIENTLTVIKDFNFYTSRKEKRSSNRFRGHYFGVDIGFNNFVTSGLDFGLPAESKFLDMNDGKSVSVALNLLQFNAGLNRKKNFGIVTGLGIEFNNYRFDSNKLLSKTSEGKLGYTESTTDVKKNKLAVTYLNLPLLFEYQMDVNSDGSPLYFSVGPVAGVKLKSHTKTVYYGSRDKVKQRGDFYLNDFRYGIMARVGLDNFNITASYYLSPLFYTDKGPELYPVSLSLGISLNF